jgi:hypothetical protein
VCLVDAELLEVKDVFPCHCGITSCMAPTAGM